MAMVTAPNTFATDHDGTRVVVVGGSTFADDDPIVVANADMFEPAADPDGETPVRRAERRPRSKANRR